MASTPPRLGSVPPAAEPELLIEIEDRQAPSRRLLRVSGELDLATVGLLRCAIDRGAAEFPEVELDLSAVAFCDVVGAAAIERAQRHLRARGRQLVLQGLDRPLHVLLTVDGLFPTLQPLCSLDGHRPPGPCQP
jgi:anti-anti-sigma factor